MSNTDSVALFTELARTLMMSEKDLILPDISEAGFTDDQLAIIFEMICANPRITIKSWNFNGNAFGEESLKLLTTLLAESKVNAVDLSHLHVTEEQQAKLLLATSHSHKRIVIPCVQTVSQDGSEQENSKIEAYMLFVELFKGIRREAIQFASEYKPVDPGTLEDALSAAGQLSGIFDHPSPENLKAPFVKEDDTVDEDLLKDYSNRVEKGLSIITAPSPLESVGKHAIEAMIDKTVLVFITKAFYDQTLDDLVFVEIKNQNVGGKETLAFLSAQAKSLGIDEKEHEELLQEKRAFRP